MGLFAVILATLNPEEVYKAISTYLFGILFFVRFMSPSTVYFLFVFAPWLGILYSFNIILCPRIAKQLRVESRFLKERKSVVYPSPVANIIDEKVRSSESLEKIKYLISNLVDYGLTLVTWAGIILQNSFVPSFFALFLPSFFVRIIGLFCNVQYTAFYVFTVHWMELSFDLRIKESQDNNKKQNTHLLSFPYSPSIVGRVSFIDKNFPYFFGFVFPIVFIPFFPLYYFSSIFFSNPLLQPYLFPLVFLVLYIYSIIVAV
jgi:hypothetical protein